MRFNVVGADMESGNDVDVMFDAATTTEVEELAHNKGILVSAIKPVQAAEKDHGSISLVDDEPAVAGVGQTGGHGTVHGTGHGTGPAVAHVTSGGTAHGDGASHGTAHGVPVALETHPAGAADAAAHGNGAQGDHQAGAGAAVGHASPAPDPAHAAGAHAPDVQGAPAMEYHILMNQALYLLETSVNKHIRDGWEPQGGLTVGVSNNALQFFQTIVRKKKV